MIAAYEDMPKSLIEKINDKLLIHDASHNSAGQLRKGYEGKCRSFFNTRSQTSYYF